MTSEGKTSQPGDPGANKEAATNDMHPTGNSPATEPGDTDKITDT